MNTYKITIAHDKGIFSLRVTANTQKRAIAMVMAAEGCPSCAILKAVKIK